MENQLLLSGVSVGLVSLFGWLGWITRKLIKVDKHLTAIGFKLGLVDWETIPQKSLNELFNKENLK